MKKKVYIYEDDLGLLLTLEGSIKRIIVQFCTLLVLSYGFGAKHAIAIYCTLLVIIGLVTLFEMSRLILPAKETDNDG